MAAALSIAVYMLCAATSLACAVLLLRGYRRSGARFLLWSSLCFVGLALNNVILFVDKVVLPARLRPARASSSPSGGARWRWSGWRCCCTG